jgi:hypothetical protein
MSEVRVKNLVRNHEVGWYGEFFRQRFQIVPFRCSFDSGKGDSTIGRRRSSLSDPAPKFVFERFPPSQVPVQSSKASLHPFLKGITIGLIQVKRESPEELPCILFAVKLRDD